MPKVLRGDQVKVFGEKYSRLDVHKKNIIAPYIHFGKGNTITITNFSTVLKIMRLSEMDIDDNRSLL